MKFCLKTYAKKSGHHQLVIQVNDRLPKHIVDSCEVVCDVHVESHGRYYLLTLDCKTILSIECQRCLQVFQEPFHHQSVLAVCGDDVTAEALIKDFECIVASDHTINILDVVTDELHLFSLEKHAFLANCAQEI